MREPTLDQFLKDVANHRMTVKMENGLYRHLRFSQANTNNLWFDLVTWPGVLTIHGDMGTWIFSRTEDMFGFFRDEKKMRINPGYWAEKLQLGSIRGGDDNAKEWSMETLQKQVVEHLEYYDLEGPDKDALLGEVKESILRCEDKYEAHMAIRNFSCDLPEHGKFSFELCEFPSGKDWSCHFIWCLYAIVWGIQQWDARESIVGGAA
jgi:hypothetical protein